MLRKTISFKSTFGSSPLDQFPRRSVDISRDPIEIPRASSEILRTLLREDDSQSSENRRIIRYKKLFYAFYTEDEENQKENIRVIRHAIMTSEMVKEI